MGHVLKMSPKPAARGGVPMTLNTLRRSPETCRHDGGEGLREHPTPGFAC